MLDIYFQQIFPNYMRFQNKGNYIFSRTKSFFKYDT